MMNTLALEADALWRILLVSLVVGAGLPALFAVGVKANAHGRGGDAEASSPGAPLSVDAPAHPAGRVAAIACFAVVVAVVLLGLTFIIGSGFGMTLDFSHVYPTLVPR